MPQPSSHAQSADTLPANKLSADEFNLDGQPDNHDFFSLEAEIQPASAEQEPVQDNLLLSEENPEAPPATPQIELDGMTPPTHSVEINDGPVIQFQHASTLLESLESQNVPVHYQCREGYCGSCRTQLVEGEVHYVSEPLAWLNENEILPCCCIPKSPIKIRID